MNLDDIAYAFYADEEGTKPDELLSQVKKLLKKDEAEIVLLHVQEDMKFKEIASYLSQPLGTVQWKYNEAMKKLRKEIKEDAY